MKNELDFYLNETIFRQCEKFYINKVNIIEPTGFHAHEFIEIAYIASGTGKHIVGENEYSAIKGSIFIINHNIPHRFIPHITAEKGMTIYNCIFMPEFLELSLINCRDFTDMANIYIYKSFFPDYKETTPLINLVDNEINETEDLYSKMLLEYECSKRGYIAILRAYVIELLVKILRAFYNKHENEKYLNPERKHIIDKVLDFISNNYAKNIRLEELSMMAFLSPSYFCRQFKEHMGVTISEYTQKIRIDEACRILRESNIKVVDISLRVGYSDIKYFNEVFKRYIGLTPSQYRKENAIFALTDTT